MKKAVYRWGLGHLILNSLVLTLALMALCSNTFGEEKMQPLYDLDSVSTLKPESYDLKQSIDELFPVPRDNAVGTNDINNAITLIGFNGKKAVIHEVARDFFKYVSGGELSYLPIFDPNVIGYAQTRRFVMVDLKSGKATQHRICYPLEETIQRVAVADAAKRQFIFSIEKFAKDTVDTSDYTSPLRLMDLSGKEPVLIKEMVPPKGVGWFKAYNKIFFYGQQYTAYTAAMEPTRHPMVEAIKQHRDMLNPFMIHPHPQMPFAILVNQKGPVSMVDWQKPDQNRLTTIFDTGRVYRFDFSPDGRWVVFQRKRRGEATFYLMPVSDRYEHYLGSPILLHEGDFLSTAWTTNPIAFVGTDGYLHRWELTRKAYPQSGNRDLHDYIVEQDLKTLKR